MTAHIQSIRGMRDILPDESALWLALEDILRLTATDYGYQNIRLPLLEKTELFDRTIGEATDIVEKEMYTFLDRNGDSLTLRPEGTAVCVRAGLQHGLLYNQKQKYWYMGPMFRYERPQKDRYRQFDQFGVETFGYPETDIECELILFTARIWKALGIEKAVTLHLNSLGSVEDRRLYRHQLTDYLSAHWEILDEDSRRRLNTNPFRILDSKNPAMKVLIEGAPKLLDVLSNESRRKFDAFCESLSYLGVTYVISPTLVRGLDYYNETVFEWITQELGAQGTLCAGGRYDGLTESLGGPKAYAFGFAMGLDRIVSLMKNVIHQKMWKTAPDVYILSEGLKSRVEAIKLAEHLRDVFQSLNIETYLGLGDFSKQFKEANKKQATIAVIIGEKELQTASASIKYLLETREQTLYSLSEISQVLGSIFKDKKELYRYVD